MDPKNYFIKPKSTAQKQYCALAAFFKDGLPAKRVAREYGYTLPAFYSLVRDFTRRFHEKSGEDLFFKSKVRGRKKRPDHGEVETLVLHLRSQSLSNLQIKSVLVALGLRISAAGVWKILDQKGVQKLRRRPRLARATLTVPDNVTPPASAPLQFTPERFSSNGGAGVFIFAGLVRALGFFSAETAAGMSPGGRAVLSALALKFANLHPQSGTPLWRFDRGLGLFAGLTVLPAWESLVQPLTSLPDGTTDRILERLNRHLSETELSSRPEGAVHYALPSIMAAGPLRHGTSRVSKRGMERIFEVDTALNQVVSHCFRLLERQNGGEHLPPLALQQGISLLGGEFEISQGFVTIRPKNAKLTSPFGPLYADQPIPWLQGRRLKFLNNQKGV